MNRRLLPIHLLMLFASAASAQTATETPATFVLGRDGATLKSGLQETGCAPAALADAKKRGAYNEIASYKCLSTNKTVTVTTPAPVGTWTKVAVEHAKFTGAGPATYRFGDPVANKWVQKDLVAGTYACEQPTTFQSDPVKYVVKECDVLGVPAPAPAPTPAPAPNDTAWVTIAAQGQDWVVFPENGQVRYGWGIAWDTKTVTTGVFGCNDWFLNEPKTGGAAHDPMPGFAKVCQKLVNAPHVTQPATGIPAVNPAFVQAAAIGIPGPRLGGSVGTGDSGNPNQDTGAMREPCAFSHFLNDDPIVFPALPGKSHLHLFFGNVAINAQTTASTITAAGNSTCAGGDLNRTGYWVPAVIDMRTGRPLVPQAELVLFYYKGGYLGVQSGGKIQPFPVGLRMIAGSASNTTENATQGVIRIWCEHGDGTIRGRIPSCNKGEQLAFEVIFPQCWDGVNLDSPNHKDHMAYATGQGCPTDHPIALPELSMNIKYVVEDSGTDTYLRLASDNYTGPGGYSMHADWFNGWDLATQKLWVANCIDPMKDCHSALMGNGQFLY